MSLFIERRERKIFIEAVPVYVGVETLEFLYFRLSGALPLYERG
jgi:hypothetical protein